MLLLTSNFIFLTNLKIFFFCVHRNRLHHSVRVEGRPTLGCSRNMNASPVQNELIISNSWTKK